MSTVAYSAVSCQGCLILIICIFIDLVILCAFLQFGKEDWHKTLIDLVNMERATGQGRIEVQVRTVPGLGQEMSMRKKMESEVKCYAYLVQGDILIFKAFDLTIVLSIWQLLVV